MPLWGKSQKNPVDVVKAIKEGLVALERGDKKSEKVSHLTMSPWLPVSFSVEFDVQFVIVSHDEPLNWSLSTTQALEDVSKNLGYAKTMLFGSAEQEAQSDYQLASLAQEMYNANLLFLLISNLSKIDFEVHR